VSFKLREGKESARKEEARKGGRTKEHRKFRSAGVGRIKKEGVNLIMVPRPMGGLAVASGPFT
jgi:hypothetical protein